MIQAGRGEVAVPFYRELLEVVCLKVTARADQLLIWFAVPSKYTCIPTVHI